LNISLGALSLYAVTVEVAVRSDTWGSIPSPGKILSVSALFSLSLSFLTKCFGRRFFSESPTLAEDE
jgi:hypothetical protein